jgi:hypothetical protein
LQVAAALSLLAIFKTLKQNMGSVNAVKRPLAITAYVACEDTSFTSFYDLLEPVGNILKEVRGGKAKLLINFCT